MSIARFELTTKEKKICLYLILALSVYWTSKKIWKTKFWQPYFWLTFEERNVTRAMKSFTDDGECPPYDLRQVSPFWTMHDIRSISNTETFHNFTRDVFETEPNLTNVDLPNFDQIVNRTHPNTTVVAYNRVNKCGSSSLLNSFLENALDFGSYDVLRYTNYASSTLSFDAQKELCTCFALEAESALDRPFLIHGHFYYTDCSQWFPEMKMAWINMIRHPVDRFVSLFYYNRRWKRRWQGHAGPENSWFHLDINHCVLNNLPECDFRPGVCREQMLTYFCGQNIECRRVGSEKALRMAKYNIEKHFSVVGVLESYSRTLSALERYIPNFFLGLSDAHEFYENSELHDILSFKAEKHLTKFMSKDFELYEFVAQRILLQTAPRF